MKIENTQITLSCFGYISIHGHIRNVIYHDRSFTGGTNRNNNRYPSVFNSYHSDRFNSELEIKKPEMHESRNYHVPTCIHIINVLSF